MGSGLGGGGERLRELAREHVNAASTCRAVDDVTVGASVLQIDGKALPALDTQAANAVLPADTLATTLDAEMLPTASARTSYCEGAKASRQMAWLVAFCSTNTA